MSPGAAVIKHYQIVSCLGQGGFGKVFEAWDSKLQRSVAIKRLNADGLLSPATDLLREARMAASLNHPAFVKIHALEDDDNSLAIVMELIKGETLKQVITNNRPDLTQSIKIIRQIAEAMKQAHALGLTHGDLKPSNIMLEPSGTIRILDFGLASKADPEATTSMLQQDPQGTIAYMAPERLLGAPLSPAIDVYALGVIFYELLTGKRPFADLNGLALAAALVQSSSDQWNYSQELSPALIHLIRRMTAKQSAQRLSAMAEVLEQLDAISNGVISEFVIAPPQTEAQPTILSESPKTELPKASRKNKFKKAVLFSFVVIGCVVFGGWFTRNVLWHFEEVIPRYSESQEMKLGMDALEQWDRPGSLDAAIKHFSNLAEQNPENAAAIAGLSIAYSLVYQNDMQNEIWLKKAIASAQVAIKNGVHLALSHVAMGRALYVQGRYEESLKSYDAAINFDPNNEFAEIGKMEALYRLGHVQNVLEMASKKITQKPATRMLMDLIGYINFNKANYKEAEMAFEKSIQIQPDAIFAYSNLSGVYLYQNRIDDALSILQQGLQIRQSALLFTNLGNLYFYKKEYLKSVESFERAVSLELGGSSDYVAWANLADALLWVPGRKNEAKKYYKKAISILIEIKKDNLGNIINESRMALYLARIGDKEDCENLLSTILSKDNLTSDIYFRAALSYELIGDRGLAIEHLSNAVQLGYPIALIDGEPDLVSLRMDKNYMLH